MAQTRARALNRKAIASKADTLHEIKGKVIADIHKQYGEKVKITDTNMGEIWRNYVRNKDQAEAMMEIMYPHLPKQVQLAYVHMFQRAINGEIELPSTLVHDARDKKIALEKVWNPQDDIAEQKLQGQIKIAEQRMTELCRE